MSSEFVTVALGLAEKVTYGPETTLLAFVNEPKLLLLIVCYQNVAVKEDGWLRNWGQR